MPENDPPELLAPEAIEEDGLAEAVPDSTLPTVVVDDSPEEQPLGRSWAFDMGAMAFTRAGLSPAETRGTATLLGWIDKCLHTEEGALPIHPPGFGLRDPFGMFGRPVSDLAAGDMAEDLRRALTFHPRIADVTNVRLERDPLDEAMTVVYTVVLDPPLEDQDLLTLRTRLN